MSNTPVSRRAALTYGAPALFAALGAPSFAEAGGETGRSHGSEAAARRYYKAWETKDWKPFDELLADNFTFTSANNDDHISKQLFKSRCWDTQIDFIKGFDLLRVFAKGNEVFVLYVGHTKNGNTFRNVEYLRVLNDRIESIECYFGAMASFASAVGSATG
ncbi:MAG TPA: nuclear transport factor 2 family protein [Casimicrobiaceae bacterium]|nr:nuclear transport factor 2 family protein [Casimicrobiaceae bacterium]